MCPFTSHLTLHAKFSKSLFAILTGALRLFCSPSAYIMLCTSFASVLEQAIACKHLAKFLEETNINEARAQLNEAKTQLVIGRWIYLLQILK